MRASGIANYDTAIFPLLLQLRIFLLPPATGSWLQVAKNKDNILYSIQCVNIYVCVQYIYINTYMYIISEVKSRVRRVPLAILLLTRVTPPVTFRSSYQQGAWNDLLDTKVSRNRKTTKSYVVQKRDYTNEWPTNDLLDVQISQFLVGILVLVWVSVSVPF